MFECENKFFLNEFLIKYQLLALKIAKTPKIDIKNIKMFL